MADNLPPAQRGRLTAARLTTPSRDCSGLRPCPTYAEIAGLIAAGVVILAVLAGW